MNGGRQLLKIVLSSNPQIALLPLHPEFRATFDSTAAWEYARNMSGKPYGYHNMIFSWVDTVADNYPPPLDAQLYYEKLGKPKPKTEVMNLMKSKDYADAKDYAGECEPIVIIAKGQNVQGTCKYGTRVDYILASPNSPYKFVPGLYSVISSKGTSVHHIVKVEIVKVNSYDQKNVIRQCRKLKRRVVRITPPCSATGVRESTPTTKLLVP